MGISLNRNYADGFCETNAETVSFFPNPLQSGHAPSGELNENNLGSKLASEYPQCGQACNVEKKSSLSLQ